MTERTERQDPAPAHRNGVRWSGGWPLVGWAAVAVTLISVGILHFAGTAEPGLRLLIRTTARLSAVLLAGVIAARPLRRLWRSPLSRWLLSNRRYLGVCFAVSHLAHALAILALARWSLAVLVRTSSSLVLIFGGVGYLFVLAMTATSLDRTAAWLGRRWWKRLHTAGIYYLTFIFLFNYIPLAIRFPAYIPLPGLLLGALALRVAAAKSAR